MQKSNPKLDSFISEVTMGEAVPTPKDEKEADELLWSGAIAVVDAATYAFYRKDNAGPPKLEFDDWFVFADSRTVSQPGILFWQRGTEYFGRLLDQEQWAKLLKVAKVTKKFW
jgi:hypothetical protein